MNMFDGHLDHETLSALLDGEADADAQAHVAGCPACGAQLQRMRSAVAAVAQAPPAPAPAEVREAAVRAALMEAALGDPKVSTLDAGREKRRQRARRVPPLGTLRWVGIAAAFIALVAAIPVLSRGSSSKSSETSASATTSAVGAGAAQPHTPTGGPPTTAASLPSPEFATGQNGNRGTASYAVVGDLGALSDRSALAAALRAQLARNDQATITPASPGYPPDATTAGTLQRCAGAAAAASASAVNQHATIDGPAVYVAQLEWRGTAANAYVYNSSAGPVAVITSQASCQVLEAFSF